MTSRMRFMSAGAVLALASGVAAQEVSRPVPVGSPGQWIMPSDYPPSALRAGAEGRVLAILGIDRTGKVTSCAVRTSSGNAALDAATCAVATTRVVFTPAKDAAGQGVPSKFEFSVRWALPTGTAAPPIELTTATRLDMEIAVELSLDGDGKVLRCRVLTATMPSFATAQGDACASFRLGMQVSPGLRRGGKPVASTVVQRITRRVTLTP
ncbi:energy transducer TonB [uncultured Sphingomonas sp.]|uniref:energy transducer TonB n=1 Tax=uncultured Sphingomonas sp. TaxID=158754 RepID=UPI0035CAD3A0